MRGKHPNFIYNVDDDHAREMKAQGLGATAIAKALGIGRASVLAGVRNQLRQGAADYVRWPFVRQLNLRPITV